MNEKQQSRKSAELANQRSHKLKISDILKCTPLHAINTCLQLK